MKRFRLVGLGVTLLLMAAAAPCATERASEQMAERTVDTSDVYAEARQIGKEVELLLNHLNVGAFEVAEPLKADLAPRHVWQQGYILLTKINVFRRKNGYPVGSISTLEPVLEFDPLLVFEQTQRILAELQMLKRRLGAEATVTPRTPAVNKRPVDVFNQLHQVSLDLDAMNHEAINASYLFAEVMRVYEDADTLLRWLRLEDTTSPPEKLARVTFADSHAAALELMGEIQRLQRSGGIERVDFSALLRRDEMGGGGEFGSSDVFTMIAMCLAEMQTLKASLDLTRAITPPAEYHEGKEPADVHQLLRWTTRKLRLIQAL